MGTASPMSSTSNACRVTVRLDRVWTSDLHECKSLRAEVLYHKEHVLSGCPFATDEIDHHDAVRSNVHRPATKCSSGWHISEDRVIVVLVFYFPCQLYQVTASSVQATHLS